MSEADTAQGEEQEQAEVLPDEDFATTLAALRSDGLDLEALVSDGAAGGGDDAAGGDGGGGESGGEGSGQQQYRLVVEPFDVTGCAEVSGFWEDSSYLRPRGMAALADLATKAGEQSGQAKALLFGHADAGEQDAAGLGERRAKAVLAALERDVDTWVALNDEESWGYDVVQELCNHLGHDCGPVDGEYGGKTKAGVESFQRSQDGAAGPVDGKPGPKTRKALFTAYFERHPAELDAGALMDPRLLSVGSDHLLQEADGPHAANRRVVGFFFKEPRLPPASALEDAAAFYERIKPYCTCEGGEVLTPPAPAAAEEAAEDGAPYAPDCDRPHAEE